MVKNSPIASGGFALRYTTLLISSIALCWLCFFTLDVCAQEFAFEQGLGLDQPIMPTETNGGERQRMVGLGDNFTETILMPGSADLGIVADQSFFAPESWAQELTRNQEWGPDHPRMLADVNGDGKQDIVGFGDEGVWIATSTGARFQPAFVLADFGTQSGWQVEKHVRTTGDINGDKLDDIVGFGDAGVYQALSTGIGFSTPTFVIADFGYDQGWRVDKHVRLLADVNGDGLKDIVAFGDDGVWLSLATSSGSFSEPAFVVANFGFNQGWTVLKHIRTTADVNGDGKQDLVGFGDDGVWIALSTGSGFDTPRFVLSDFGFVAGIWRTDRHPRLLVDIDNDGMQDIVAFGDAGVWIARSNGSGFEPARFVLADFGYNQGWRADKHPRYVADLNGDGYQDIVGFGDDLIYRSLGSPTGFAGLRGMLRDLIPGIGYPWNSPAGALSIYFSRFVGDVNGDGMQDLIAFDNADIKVVRSSNLPPPPPPKAPSNPRITGNTSTSLSIAWNDNSNDERRFYINYGKSGSMTKVTSVGANVVTATLSSLDPDTQYCFTVQAENLWGFSPQTYRRCGRTKVEQVMPPTPPEEVTGYSSINVFNCISEQRPLYIWTRDVTQSYWVQRGIAPSLWSGGSCPGSAAPFVVPLQDGRSFWFAAVDPQLIGCDGTNDPQYSACQRSIYTSPLQGDKDGPAVSNVIG